MAELHVGDKAPSFNLEDQEHHKVRLSNFKGHKVLLYFYPKAMTSGCTKQACSVRDHLKELKKMDVVPVGVSPDDSDAQSKFDEKNHLGFELLSDVSHETAESYGVWGTKKMYGKEYEGIIRSAFLIDEKGKVAGAWYKVKPEETVSSVMSALS